ncbi:maleylpyruvate isomerase family mycothiol-dependent enzyme [Streptomyces violascens]|uniref:maleylpyruvate isomerase family mycothiol-dependent enzyme n=1 Tax=Streptomyces violascens TaxID=67381 RepID=UPI003660BA94
MPRDETQRRLDAIAAVHKGLRARVAELDEPAMRAPTALPGWRRAHVVTHLADLAWAFARQARCTREGRVVEVYDGGRPARDTAIELGATRHADALAEALNDGLCELEQAWADLSPEDWTKPCGYRNSALLATQLCWWREVHIHSVDLDIGVSSEGWGEELCRHIIGYLLPRLPGARTTVLLAGDDRWEHGRGAPTTVHGTHTTLAAWLTGRPAARRPRAYGAGDSLPELGPWP